MNKLLFVLLALAFFGCKKDDKPEFGGDNLDTYVYLSCYSCKIEKSVNNKIIKTYNPSSGRIYINPTKNGTTQLIITYNDTKDQLCVYDFVINKYPVTIIFKPVNTMTGFFIFKIFIGEFI